MTTDVLLYEQARHAQLKAVKARRRKVRRANGEPSRGLDVPRLSPSQKQGRKAEDRARCYLEDKGMAIIAQNLQNRTGEIDLVAIDKGTLVFVEVRDRKTGRYGGAAGSVTRAKQLRLIRTAHYYLPRLTERYFNGNTPPCRFDVVTIEAEELVWIHHAFALV